MRDSTWQYQQAISAQFSDHHPPLMAYLWRALAYWHAGSGLMFLLQIGLIYFGVGVLMLTADQLSIPNHKLATLLLLILPIYPQILIYEVVVIKDVQFAASFLLCGAILAYFTIKQKKPSLLVCVAFLLLLIYGTTVKYQAKFIVIIFALWIGSLLCLGSKLWLKILVGLSLYVGILSTVIYFNNVLTTEGNQAYAWQYVKLYDLAAMSISEQHDLLPSYNKTANYSFNKLQTRFKYPAVDTLVFMQDPVLTITKNSAEMHELCKIWWQSIIKHPWIYLKHRLINMRYMLLARPGFNYETQDVPLTFVNNVPENLMVHNFVAIITGTIFFLFMAHLPVILLGIYYFVLGIFSWRKTNAAKVLVAFTSTALLMVVVLFFKSMAGTPRYTYISIVLIHAAHIFAYACLSSNNK